MSEKILRLLLVDDSREDRAMAKEALLKGSTRHYQFQEAGTCAEASAILRKPDSQLIDCLILDYNLPDCDAPDFIESLPRDEGLVKLPVLVLTGSSTHKNRSVIRAGAQEYLGKTWLSPESITRAVENAMDRHAMARQMAEAHARVKASDEFSRTVINSSPDCVKVLDLEGNFLSVNQFGLALLELDDFEQLRGKSWPAFWPAESSKAVRRAVQAARAGHTSRFEGACPTGKGTLKWWDVIVSPILNDKGAVARILSVSRDVTAAKRNEERLRESEERFRNMADNSPVMMRITDAAGKCVYLNSSWYRVTGQSPESASWREAIHPEDREVATRSFKEANERRAPYRCEYRLRHGDGHYIWVIDAASPRGSSNDPLGYVGSMVDITEIVRARETLTEHRQQLERLVSERTAKLQETIGELESVSYSLSHDMRQPLRSMQQFSQILLEDYGEKLDQTGKSHLNRMITAASRLDRLIQDVLTYSRLSRAAIQQASINLHSLVTDIINQYPIFHLPNATITIKNTLLPVYAAQAPLTQIISNLLGNAVKFVPPSRKPEIEISTEEVGGQVRLWICDNGIGIVPEDLARIWRMFERGSANLNYEGTGIGLNIVRKAAERMGGSSGVESVQGKGSRFWVQLPKVPDAAAA